VKVIFLAVVSFSACASTHAQTLSSETYTIEQSAFGQPYLVTEEVEQDGATPEETDSEDKSRTPTGNRERELLEYLGAVLGGDVSTSGAIEYANTGSLLWPGMLNQTQRGAGQEDVYGVFNKGTNNQNLESGYVVEESPVIEAPGFQKNRVTVLFVFLMLCALMTFRIVGLRRF
jgi:hypothetical protein